MNIAWWSASSIVSRKIRNWLKLERGRKNLKTSMVPLNTGYQRTTLPVTNWRSSVGGELAPRWRKFSSIVPGTKLTLKLTRSWLRPVDPHQYMIQCSRALLHLHTTSPLHTHRRAPSIYIVWIPNFACVINSPWPMSVINFGEIGWDLREGAKHYFREIPICTNLNFCFGDFNEKITIFGRF